uniref:HMG box domain-containing protein n=1 Tax=viral metagenome TaxID=1070528 RepID=A0A6C0KBG7_9ZZZZ
MPTKAELTTQLAAAKAEISTLKDSASSMKPEKKPRLPSEYNKFVKAKFAKTKEELGADATAKAVLTKIASEWKDAPENPKNA